jgi:hypothetical protein
MKKKNNELDYTQENSKTLEARFGNVYYKNSKPEEFTDNMGKCKAVHMYGTVISGKLLPGGPTPTPPFANDRSRGLP